MSKKAPKKTDMGKAWIRPRRDARQMIAPEYHLIITEGTDTEPLYFQRIKEIIDARYRNRIHLGFVGKGDNTLNLFLRAQKDVSRSSNIYKHVWLVYDKDDFPPEHFDRTADLCDAASTEETHYHAVWSNQCIELWFLLHFMFLQSDLHRSEYWPKLTYCLKRIRQGNYYKSRPDMFDVLRPFMEEALRNAKRLDELNLEKVPSKSSPGTKVYLLIETLKPYL